VSRSVARLGPVATLLNAERHRLIVARLGPLATLLNAA
jgi:hypothetical protein